MIQLRFQSIVNGVDNSLLHLFYSTSLRRILHISSFRLRLPAIGKEKSHSGLGNMHVQ